MGSLSGVNVALVAFFEVITFFGVAAFFAWLEFLALLNDMVSHVIPSQRKQARQILVGISDFFLMSFVSFATAIIADYLYHNGFYIGSYFFGALYHFPLVYFMVVWFFPIGIVAFCIPTLYIRAILRGERALVTPTQNVFRIMGALFNTALMFFTAWLGYTLIPFLYSNIVWAAAFSSTILGLLLTVKKMRFRDILLFAPLWLFMMLLISIVVDQFFLRLPRL